MKLLLHQMRFQRLLKVEKSLQVEQVEFFQQKPLEILQIILLDYLHENRRLFSRDLLLV